MKLSKDFGVRALLGTLAGVGLYGTIAFILIHYNLDTPALTALVAIVAAPFTTAISFYFATRTQTPQNPPDSPR